MPSKTTLIDPIPCFVPLWTNAIRTAHLKISSEETDDVLSTIRELELCGPNGEIDYADTACCLVGEAHGFPEGVDYADHNTYDGNYQEVENPEYCRFCLNQCRKPALKAVKKGGDVLTKFKVKLYNHMIDEHGMKGNKIDISKIPKIKDMAC